MHDAKVLRLGGMSPQAMVELPRVEQFNFYGDILDVVKDGKTLWVSVRRVCEALEINQDGQRVKLKEKTWARTEIISVPDARGHNQTAFMIALKSLPMWLATIEPGRVPDQVREKLARFQAEAADVLENYFFRGYAVNPVLMHQPMMEHALLMSRHETLLRCYTALAQCDLFRPDYLQRKANHSLAIIAGTTEVSGPRAIDVEGYLTGKGLKRKQVKRHSPYFGKLVKSHYVAKHGEPPKKCYRDINGSDRLVFSYMEDDLPIFDAVWRIFLDRHVDLREYGDVADLV